MKLKIFAVIALLSIQALYSMQETNYTYDPRGLLIFLDDSEHDSLGAISSSLIIALYQNVGPLIVSKSLLVNIFPRYERLEQETPREMYARYLLVYQEARQGNKSALKEEKYIFSKALAFDAEKWLFKKINDSLYLLIPNDYLKTINITVNEVKKYDPKAKLSATELTIGLKVNHMETVDFSEIKGPIKEYVAADYFMDALYNEVTKTSAIFCTRTEYKGWKKVFPAWTLYIEGHGYIQQSIVNLTLKDFRKLLKFLENKINIKLLVYRSCYAAGLNNEIIFKDAKSAINKTYSFAIVTQALTDISTYALILLQLINNQVVILAYENFAYFLTAVITTEIIHFAQIISTIFPLTPPVEYRSVESQRWGNVPQIKLPGIEWFSVLASNKDIVSLGSILAKTRDPDKSLDVVKFFKTDPKALLIYAQDIPFELIINASNIEAIISMIPGDAVHTMKKIVSAKKNVYELLQLFMAMKNISPEKIFFINEINEVRNVLIYHKEIPGIPALKLPSRYESYAICEKDTVLYMFEPGKQMQLLENDVLKRHYLQLRAQLQGKSFELGNLIFARKADIAFPPLLGPTIIEKIEGKHNLLSDILFGIKFKIPEHGLVWVNEITAQYDDIYTALPHINKGAVITINDVVIDKDTNEIFYRFGNSFYQGKQKIDYDYRDEYRERLSRPIKRPVATITQEQIENIKKIVQQKIKKGPLEEVKQKEQQEMVLKQSLFELKQRLTQLEGMLRTK